MLRFVNLTLPVEKSNDPRLLIDIGVFDHSVALPIRLRIFPSCISIGLGDRSYLIKLDKT